MCCTDRSWKFIFGHGKVVENHSWKRVVTLTSSTCGGGCGRRYFSRRSPVRWLVPRMWARQCLSCQAWPSLSRWYRLDSHTALSTEWYCRTASLPHRHESLLCYAIRLPVVLEGCVPVEAELWVAGGLVVYWLVIGQATQANSASYPQWDGNHHHNRFTAPLRWAGARRELLDFMVQGEINKGSHTDHLAGCHSIRTNQCPPPPHTHIYFMDRIPFMPPNQQCQSTEGN